jgi:hypothetical protein
MVSAVDNIPLMALAAPRALGALSQVELMIHELQPAAAGEHVNVAAAGSEAPVELFDQLMTPHILKAPGVRAYLGEVDSKPVTTGLGVTLADLGTPRIPDPRTLAVCWIGAS